MLQAGKLLFRRKGYGLSTWGFSGTQPAVRSNRGGRDLGSSEPAPVTERWPALQGCRAVHLATSACFPISKQQRQCPSVDTDCMPAADFAT